MIASIALWIVAVCSVGAMLLATILYLIAGKMLRPPLYQHAAQAPALAPIEKGSMLWQFLRGMTQDPMTDCGLAYEEVSFPAHDNAMLRGWFVPGPYSSTTAIVTVHGAWMDRRNFLNRLPMLHRTGYAVLMFDCREHGISDGAGRGCSLGHREHQDVSAAVHYLKTQRNIERVGVMGTSQGGASAILAMAKDPNIEAVVAESSFASFRSNHVKPFNAQQVPTWIVRLIARAIEWRLGVFNPVYPLHIVDRIVPRPLFLIHGEADDLISADHSRLLYARAGEPKSLWIEPQSGHDGVSHDHPEEYERRVGAFLTRYLPLCAHVQS